MVLVIEVIVIQLILAIKAKVIGWYRILLSIFISYNILNTKSIRMPIIKGSPGKLTASPNSFILTFNEKGVVMMINHSTLSSEKR